MDNLFKAVKLLILLACVVHNAVAIVEVKNVTIFNNSTTTIQLVETIVKNVTTTTTTIRPVHITEVDTTTTTTVKPAKTTVVDTTITTTVQPIKATIEDTTQTSTVKPYEVTVTNITISSTVVKPVNESVVNKPILVGQPIVANATIHIVDQHLKNVSAIVSQNISAIVSQNVTASAVQCTNKTFVLLENLVKATENLRCIKRFHADLNKLDTHLLQKSIDFKKDHKYGNLILMMRRLLNVLNTTVTINHRANLTNETMRPVPGILFKRPPINQEAPSVDDTDPIYPASYNMFIKMARLQYYRPLNAERAYERRPNKNEDTDDTDDSDDSDDDEVAASQAHHQNRLYNKAYFYKRHY